MPSRRGLPPVVIWRGVNPSHATMSRPRRKALALPTAATSAVALIVPIPGIVTKRRTGSSFRAIWTNSLSKTAIRSSRARHSVRRSSISSLISSLMRGLSASIPSSSAPIFIRESRKLLLQFAPALRRHDPTLQQQRAQRVDQRGALRHQPPFTRAMQRLNVRLSLAPDLNEPHRRPARRLRDRRGVQIVVLLCLH